VALGFAVGLAPRVAGGLREDGRWAIGAAVGKVRAAIPVRA
jgi:hypothetical protein